MKLKDLLSEDQLEDIKKVGHISEELKGIMSDQKLNTYTQNILLQILDENAEDLIKSIVDDTFFEYMNKKTEKKK